MSVDPAAAAPVNGAGSAALDALVAAELNALAADAQALGAQVAVGDVVTATVLPPNGLTDLLNILGNRVAAALPPNLLPGDVITAQVTGFEGTQIMLQVLSSSPPPPASSPAPPPLAAAPPPTTSSSAPAALPQPAVAVSAPPLTVPAPSVPATPVPATPAPAAVAAPLTPAIAAPVTAAVAVAVPTTPAPTAPPAAADAATSGAAAPPAPAPSALPTNGVAPSPAAVVAALVRSKSPHTSAGDMPTEAAPTALGGIEARLAAARAAALTVLAPGRVVPPPAAAAPTRVTLDAPGAAAPTAGGPSVPPVGTRPFVVPPAIVQSRYAEPPTLPGGAPVAPAAARSATSYQDPVALVRALRLPVTPPNVAAATLALAAPQRLPTALVTLATALPASDDPRVATLHTLIAFIARIESASPQLATQIAAYVEHVVGGSEPGLANLLNAHEAASRALPLPAEPPPAEPPLAANAGQPAAAPVAPARAATAAAPPLPVVALAQVAERTANIAGSLKEQLFSLLAGPPPSGRGGEDTVPAAASALTAVTAVQLAAAQAVAVAPQTLSLAVPLWLGSSYAQAQIAVDRDAPDAPNVPLDGDNFHIAFVLDTKNLGTVAVDLRTVGRAFSLSVKTENVRTAERFGDELSRLTDRLATLRYRAMAVEAVVAAPISPAVVASAAPDAATRSVSEPGVNERA